MKLNSKAIRVFFKNNEIETKAFIFIFYAVGIFGMLLPKTFPLFVQLIPFALLLSSVLLALFHDSDFNPKNVIIFILIFLLSFSIEMIGVNTGLIFGIYQYGNSLGIKIFNTPLIIGLNWLVLIYISASLFEKFKIHPILKILLASSLLVIYDLVLERVAPKLDMWSFNEPTVPLQNYVAWFVVAFLLHSAIKVFKVNCTNKLASIILVAQFVFFLVLAIYLID